MFKENKYTQWYFALMDKAKYRNNLTGYTERHHIIPKCIDGLDDSTNITTLTAREHFVSHLLLTKMHDSEKLVFAVFRMLSKNKYQHRIINSRYYQLLKIKHAEACRLRNKNRVYASGYVMAFNPLTNEYKRFASSNDIPDNWLKRGKTKGSTNSNKGKTYYYCPTTLIVKSFSKKDCIPSGWLAGNPNADTSNQTPIRNSSYYYCPVTGKEARYLKDAPIGWIKGRSIRWITNGESNIQINKVIDKLPIGYYNGRTNKIKSDS